MNNIRTSANFEISAKDMWDTYSVAFEMCVSPEGGAATGVMCAYDAINGVPNCANKEFLTNMLRKRWKFDGYIISDAGATSGILYGHEYTNTTSEAIAAALDAGMDQDLSSGGQVTFMTFNLPDAIAKGHVTRDMMATALKRQFRVLMRLGLFDSAQNNPFNTFPVTFVNNSFARKLALDSA